MKACADERQELQELLPMLPPRSTGQTGRLGCGVRFHQLRTRHLLGLGQQRAGACLKDYTPSLSLAPETLYVDARSS
jgi:hypothetical protein